MNSKLKKFFFFISAIIVGIINGFFGGGGGIICVPIIKFLLKLPDKKAHATSVLIMAIISIPTIFVYITTLSINWTKTIILTLSVLLGGLFSTSIIKKINDKTLNIIFVLLMLIAGIKMLF